MILDRLLETDCKIIIVISDVTKRVSVQEGYCYSTMCYYCHHCKSVTSEIGSDTLAVMLLIAAITQQLGNC